MAVSDLERGRLAVGNFIVMRLLVGSAHMPVLAANLVSIAVCGLANFGLGDKWAFAEETPASGA